MRRAKATLGIVSWAVLAAACAPGAPSGGPGPGYPGSGYPGQAYPGQPYPGQPYPGPGYPRPGVGPAAPQGGAAMAPQGAPEELVELALRAAAAGDFEGYLALIHSNEKQNALQVTNIREYSWKRFSQQASWYRDPGGRVQIARRQQEGGDLMLYVQDFRNAGRLPPPMRLRPDGGAWRIVTNSL